MGRIVSIFALVTIALAACSGRQQQSASPSPSSTAAAAATAVTQASATATAIARARARATPAFTDIQGLDGEVAIDSLAALGVFDTSGDAFHPSDPLTRATFVRWLVKANNALFTNSPAQRIRLAEMSQPTFADVPASNLDYKYVQGMVDAGFVIGYDAHHFRPNRNVSREELLAILFSRNVGGGGTHNAGPPTYVADGKQVSKMYWGVFDADAGQEWRDGQPNEVQRIFGAARYLHPRRLATREEAAIALQRIDDTNVPTPQP